MSNNQEVRADRPAAQCASVMYDGKRQRHCRLAADHRGICEANRQVQR